MIVFVDIVDELVWELGVFLYELDGVVICVWLIGDVVCSFDVGMFDWYIVYLIFDVVVISLFVQLFCVCEMMVVNFKVISVVFRVYGIGCFEIKKCGVDIDFVVFCRKLVF